MMTHPDRTKPIRVLVVDDSAIVRKILTDCLAAEPDIEVAGTAPDAIIAREKIRTLNPDVVTLDIEMPRLDGISFLREVMKDRPMPVIIISSIAGRGCAAALEAIEAGAVEVLAKPSGPYSVGDLRLVLAQKVRSAARARIGAARPAAAAAGSPPVAPAMPVCSVPRGSAPGRVLVAMGASTGGTEAIRHILQHLPDTLPPIVIVQHIPAVFSRAFADRLDGLCRLRVSEASGGEVLEPGIALIAPGDSHMLIRRQGSRYTVEVRGGPRVCYQRPSVDVLFHSVADSAAEYAIGVLLTGMGSDGARGLLEMRRAGARTIAQDERTSVVYGMPREAERMGAVERVLPLDAIAAAICGAVESAARGRALPAPAL
ncbi:MAG TPA: chemotaxis response regulator protein-glutamate methylesterase [Bryobacteraceae bacterium]|nr:chemotaxis response regulator protein-glutamate methylesterase [Bryobacteraceae bacterium]